jgi:methylglutaconyl-CoA hydratase
VVSLLTLPVPVLAVVQGPAVAGGFGLVLACDMVLMADQAYFALPEPKRGITAAVVSPMLVYRAGAATASYILLSGKNIAAADAHRLGLCHEVASAASLPECEQQLAASILSQSKTALSTTKVFLREWAGPTLLDQIDRAMAISAKARDTADAREGLQAFLEKRNPSWQS